MGNHKLRWLITNGGIQPPLLYFIFYSFNFHRWSQGYSGGDALYIDKETICYKCGSCIKFVSDDGSSQQYFPSAGDGVGVLAAHAINKVFAFSEACLEPRIFIFSYPLLDPVSEIEGKSLFL